MSITVEPLTKAAARMGAKVAVGTARTNAQMEAVPLAMRERAFWSARLESAHLAQGMLDMLKKATSLERHTVERQGKQVQLVMSRDLFIREARKMIAASDYKLGDPAWEGTLLDHRSAQRLGLIYDFNIRQASEYARLMAGQDEGALEAYPAQELVRESARMVPRPWRERWQQHGGRNFGGRMIALKSDPIWTEISRFKSPFPPFDFNSGMGVEDVSRADAEACGLIQPGETPKRADVGFNDNLQASVKGLSQPVVNALNNSFDKAGGIAVVKDGVAQWNTGHHSLAIAMDIPAAISNAKMIKAVVADVAAVHDYTDTAAGVGIPLTPVGDTMSPVGVAKGWSAEYFRRAPGTNMPSINVSPTRGEPLYVAHEIGHEVDHRLFGQGDQYGSHINRELDPLMKAIKDSPEIKAIKAMTIHGNSPAAIRQREFQVYLLKKEERFARAYSQWIAERTGRMEYLVSIDHGINGWSSQWKKETFAPIAAEFEKLFKAKGWLR
ncbi:MAG: hypothetical protein WCO94_11650 [Verrucomicrobiota bacterium]